MKKEEALIEKFKQLESEIIEKLQSTELSIDFSLNEKDVVKILKNYALKVKKVEKLFDEYEKTAEQIGELTGEEYGKQDVTNAVVELREDSEEIKTEIEKMSKMNNISEIENIDGKVVVKKKKKNSGGSILEK